MSSTRYAFRRCLIRHFFFLFTLADYAFFAIFADIDDDADHH